MKKHLIPALFLYGLWGLLPSPALAVSKETIRMMQQLDDLQQKVANLQSTLDTQSGILRTLIQQTSENVVSMKATVADLQKTMGQNLASTNARFDSMTSQIQALSESLEEAKARLAKLSDQMAQTQNILQTLPASGPQPGAATSGSPPPPAIPDADTLYKSAYSDFNSGQYPLALQEFQQYLQYYGSSDKASNAQFYIGECYYRQEKFEQAIEEYNKCLERYPDGNKSAAAQLKKAYALLELGQKQAGVKELRSLMQRYPGTNESSLARQRLRKLGYTR
ncbi:MAG TPA: tol-pal system protein YbgF [Terriglobia bacterium]|nr:tol-pal system protein YbgF [Terriglobia bacterium]